MDDIAALRRNLRIGGYSPIPCIGKIPPLKEWEQKISTNDAEISLWGKLYPDATNTGALCKYMPTVDIDIKIADAAAAVEHLVRTRNEGFGDILVRFGNSPKRAIPLRTDQPFKKMKIPLIAPDGSTGQKIEILGDGQQVIVHGMHPDTKRPYSWFGRTPFETPLASLPQIQEHDAKELITDAIDLLIKEHGYESVRESEPQANGGGADWKHLLDAIHAGHNLHENTMILAAKLIASGMSEGSVVNFVRVEMQRSQAPHDQRWQERYDDIPRLVAGIVAKRQQPPPAAFQLIRFRDLRPGPTGNYLIKGVIPKAGIVIVWGPPKCGKSFWMFDLMMHVALGWPYRGLRVASGPVVYCAFEGADGFRDRAEAFRRHHEIDPGRDIPFFLLPSHAKLVRDHQPLINAIRAQAVAPVAVVLDTLNRSIDGSESKDEDMGAYLSAAEAIRAAFGCVVPIVHHCGVAGDRPRGHTSLTGAADAQLAVKRDDDGNVLVKIECMKDGPEGAEFTSRLDCVEVGADEDGDPKTSCIVVATKIAAKPPRLPRGSKLAWETLTDLITEVGEIAPASNHIPQGVKVVPVPLWRETYKKAYPTDKSDTSNKAFIRASTSLQEARLIGIWSDKAWIAPARPDKTDKAGHEKMSDF
jgi:hypothetical protein